MRAVRAIWICFLLRVFFYAAVLPVWEGYDEWSHFAVIRLVALRGQLLPPRDSMLPEDVAASIDIVPVPWAWKQLGPPVLTHDEFWQLPRETREAREMDFRVLPRNAQWKDSTGPYRAHEAFQPPLYYWIMAPLMSLFAGAGIARQLLMVRWFGALLCSFTIPLVYRIARQALDHEALALGCAAVVAVMPGFALVAGHAGNDCLAAPIFALLIWCSLRIAAGNCALRDQVALGVVLGLGLLTKAYFLTAVPAILVLLIWKLRARAAIAVSCALLVGGWWYARSYLQTGTLTGLTDFVMARGAHPESTLQQVLSIYWPRAIDSILFSHIYAGGWSFLQVRSWMYHVFYAVMLLALIGLARARRTASMLLLAGFYAGFWLGELYHVIIIWAARGVATSMGYYIYGVVAAEVPLCTAGLAALLRKGPAAWAAAVGVILFGALDLYAMHAMAIPYYTGLIRHKPNGALAALHAADLNGIGIAEILHRMVAFKAPVLSGPSIFLLWSAYIVSTVILLWIPLKKIGRR
jgi:4-amino-4-deoxy-L-arabinose transferase-like glycosyltransferase